MAAVLAIVAVVTAGTVVAVTVQSEDVPEEAQVGERITASWTLTDLYQNPSYDQWAVGGETELRNVTWTIEFYDLSGELLDKQVIDAREINTSRTRFSESEGVSEVVVRVSGDVPPIGEGDYTYPEKEQFLVAELVQARQGGADVTIDTWQAHHYTQAGREARNALDAAQSAIQSARESGANVSGATNDFEQAKQAYTAGNFQLAVDLANDAESAASAAVQTTTTATTTTTTTTAAGGGGGGGGNTLLLVGGVVILLLVAGGGFLYWQRSGDDQGTRLQ